MPTEIVLPELGDGIESGDVLQVLVSEGDIIAKDQGIIELETDKATVEVPSTQAGRVTKVLVSSGENVAVGSALIEVEPETSGAAPQPSSAPKESPSKAEEPRPSTDAEPAQPTETAPPAAESAPPKSTEPPQQDVSTARPATPAPPPSPSQPAVKPAAAVSDAAEIPAGPAIRRLAREVGVDLNRVSGTGESGRITRDDVMNVVRSGGTSAEDKEEETATDGWGPIRVEPMAKIRKTIAAKMFESWSTAPRVTNFDDADITKLEQMRQSSKSDYAEKGIKLTSMPFIIKAVAMSLRNHPTVNATLDAGNDQIIYKQYVNIGIAVDTDRGLVVPSLRGADSLAIPDIARELMQVAEKARNNSFSIDELRGSTFTISNLGAIGGTYSTPIINVPEVAILLVGRSRKLPVVVDDEVQIRLMMPLSLSYDHRLVDGATAARFLNEVIGFLEAPSRLFLSP